MVIHDDPLPDDVTASHHHVAAVPANPEAAHLAAAQDGGGFGRRYLGAVLPNHRPGGRKRQPSERYMASAAEWLMAWDTSAMMKLWRREAVSSASTAEWLRAWDTGRVEAL